MAGAPVVTPLYQSVNYVTDVGRSDELLYPRYGNTPNAEYVRQKQLHREMYEKQ